MTHAPWTILKEHRCFGGHVQYVEHASGETKTNMRLSLFVPEGVPKGAVIWLSGLTCTEENFMTKAGAQSIAAAHNIMIVCPDTSPRGLDLPGIRDHWDFGEGASFYVDAVTPGYADHFRMYSYVTRELYELIAQTFDMAGRISIMGHSMGGHGALIMGLREPRLFCSVSAFAPIVHPTTCPWGQKAFRGYLGPSNTQTWADYDACELLRLGYRHPGSILLDQGLSDPFMEEQRLTKPFADMASTVGQAVELKIREGYDHSYYFITTFIASHFAFHAKAISE
jgi:S-formylglutathione hydrolase